LDVRTRLVLIGTIGQRFFVFSLSFENAKEPGFSFSGFREKIRRTFGFRVLASDPILNPIGCPGVRANLKKEPEC
jgi:hypothetical protein